MKRLLAGLVASCFLPAAASATSIGAGAFGASAIIESFEGVAVGLNVRQSPFANIVEPGLFGNYTFGSGITLSSPVPNPGTMSNGAFDSLHGATVPTSFAFDFATDVLRMGAYVTGAAAATVRIDVYGSLGNLLESAQVATVPVSAWKTNFLGIESTSGIRRVVFSGVDFGIDGLAFESSGGIVPVSEPSTMVFMLVGLIGLSAAGRRTRRLRLLQPRQC
jgi:hypothetical protein